MGKFIKVNYFNRLQRRVLVFVLFLFVVIGGYSTHNRAGNITYTHLGDYSFIITITTYTRIGAGVEADRDTLNIDWGQGGPNADIPRTSKKALPFTGGTIQENIYSRNYTFSGPGRYTMTVKDPNRNQGILNIPGSVNMPFCIQSQLIIDPWAGFNSSVQFKTRAVEFICGGKPWYYNPGAYDIDGDSLVFSLVASLGDNGQPLPGFILPHKVDNLGKTFEINSSTGDIYWDQPELVGEYNVAVLVEEFDRKTRIKKGSVLRDIQITVDECEGDPPVIYGVVDTCVEAGDTLNMRIWASDPDGDSVKIIHSGTPFDIGPSPATFKSCNGNVEADSCGYFNWATACENIGALPYPVYFTAIERKSLGYSTIKKMNIYVVGPAPQFPFASPKGNEMNLSWTKPNCANVVGYRIYHRVDSSGFVPGYCEIGVPAYTGYQLVGEVKGSDNTTFVHTNVSHGQRMCYLVTAIYNDGVEGYASEEFCSYLKRDVPIITNVTVNVTDPSLGSDSLKWVNPIELDTVVSFKGPYHYKVYQGAGFNEATNLVFTTPASAQLWQTQTWFRQNGFSTSLNANVYRLDLYSGDVLVGSSQSNSSVFLKLTPDDNQFLLTWEANVGWINYRFIIYRKKLVDLNFLPVDTISSNSYLDTGLTNGETYCYFVKTVGKYSLDKIPNPLVNLSQVACGIPVDLTPPCSPVLAVNPDCDATTNYLTWNITESCAGDAELYNVYYRPTNQGPFTLVKTNVGKYNTEFLDFLPNSIAACYYVTAVDSINNLGNRNESLPSNIVCVENCPLYELPNVFTPNGDKINDLFVPTKNRFIESVEFIVYNRWGSEVFKTTDPGLFWDGSVNDEYLQFKGDGADGVYYYVCRFNAITLEGLKPDQLKGYIHMFYDEKVNGN